YRVIGSFTGKQGERQLKAIDEAFRDWSRVNLATGLATTFRPVLFGDEGQDILIQKASIGQDAETGVRRAGRTVSGEPLPDGYIVGALVQFNSDEGVLLSDRGYKKAANHEAGHVLGLGDSPSETPKGRTVMNGFKFNQNDTAPFRLRDDYYGNVPMTVRSCDALRAQQAAYRPWP